MAKSELIGVGVIGAGIIGEQHARVYRELPQTTLIGVVDVNPQRAQKVAEKYGCNWYTNYSELFEQEDVRAVSIATPDHLHYDIVVSALKAGKHVLVEKPLTTSLEEARKIVQVVEEQKRILMVNYNNRWATVYQRARALITEGEIGTPVMAYARKSNSIIVPTQMLSWARNSSCVHFLATHDIDMVRWLFDEPNAVEVYAVAYEKILRSKGIATPDGVQAIVRFENGAVATFESAWIYPSSYPTLTESYLHILGDLGVIQIDRREENLILANKKGFSFPRTCLGGEIDGQLRSSFRYALEHFVSSVIEGRRPATDGKTALKVVEIAVAIHLSIKEGRPLKLPL